MKIGFRTLKTAIGVALSVFIAQSLGLQYFTAAGILTLLCIQKSRKQSFQAALSRLFACLISLFASTLLFEAIGYGAYTFLVLLLFFIPLTVSLGIHQGIASSIVIVMHVYMHGQWEWSFFLNEICVILIGLGVALAVNWYMPSIDKELNRHKDQVDGLIAAILKEISLYLKEGQTSWDGNELLLLGDTLRKASELAVLDDENSLHRKDNSYRHYFGLKRRQYEILDRMLPAVSGISIQMEQGHRIGELIEEMNAHMSGGIPSPHLGEKLRSIREFHKLLPMPVTRDEFENRASLYAVANELERFIETL